MEAGAWVAAGDGPVEDLLARLHEWKSTQTADSALEALRAAGATGGSAAGRIVLAAVALDLAGQHDGLTPVTSTSEVFTLSCAALRCVGAAEMPLVGPQLSSVCRAIAKAVGSDVQAANAVAPLLRHVVDGMAQAEGGLAVLPPHADLLQMYLAGKQYRTAAQLLSVPFVKAARHTSPQDFLRFFYYAGRVFTGLKRWDEAIHAFRSCMATPTRDSVSQVAVCAYKQYVLVSLIHKGAVRKLAKYVPKAVTTSLQSNNDKIETVLPYDALASAFAVSADKVRTCIQANAAQFEADGNTGLVKQVEAAFLRAQVRNLKKTYITLELGEIAERVGLPGPNARADAEALLRSMVQAGEIAAKLDASTGMVRFVNASLGPAFQTRMEEQLARLRFLMEQLGTMDARISSSSEYLTTLARGKADPSATTFTPI